jgi:hypothetical protein
MVSRGTHASSISLITLGSETLRINLVVEVCVVTSRSSYRARGYWVDDCVRMDDSRYAGHWTLRYWSCSSLSTCKTLADLVLFGKRIS